MPVVGLRTVMNGSSPEDNADGELLVDSEITNEENANDLFSYFAYRSCKKGRKRYQQRIHFRAKITYKGKLEHPI